MIMYIKTLSIVLCISSFGEKSYDGNYACTGVGATYFYVCGRVLILCGRVCCKVGI